MELADLQHRQINLCCVQNVSTSHYCRLRIGYMFSKYEQYRRHNFGNAVEFRITIGEPAMLRLYLEISACSLSTHKRCKRNIIAVGKLADYLLHKLNEGFPPGKAWDPCQIGLHKKTSRKWSLKKTTWKWRSERLCFTGIEHPYEGSAQ